MNEKVEGTIESNNKKEAWNHWDYFRPFKNKYDRFNIYSHCVWNKNIIRDLVDEG